MRFRPRPAEAGAARDRASQARRDPAEGRARHPKKSRGLLREGIDMKFSFIAKHRGIWPAGWLCEALGVSRGGFYAWLTRPRSQRSRSDEELGAKVRTSFVASDRTYGARRVWKDMLAEGLSCGLHRIESARCRQSIAASERPCSSSRSERLYQASANVGSARVAARSATSASILRPVARNMFPRLNGGALLPVITP